MKRRYALSLYVGLPGLWVLACLPVLAADARCPRLEVEADENVESTWPGVASRIHDAFDAREDTDGCAKVRLLKREASIDLEVVLPDGRSARRSELLAEDVLPVLEGLLVLPGRVSSAAPLAAASTPFVAARPKDVDSDSERTAPLATADASSPSLGFEVSLATGARIGDGLMGVGFGASSTFEFANLLLGLGARLDSYTGTSGGPLTPALEFAAVGGYRFRSDGVAVSLYAGPAWAKLQTSTSSAAPAGTTGDVPMPEVSESFTPRFCAGARFDLGMQSVLRTFLGIDGVIGPAGRAAEGVPPGTVRRLPEWMLGVALGATLGTI